MSKYIDQERVLEYIIFGVVGKDVTCGELKRAIESLPTTEIVHCAECKYCEREESIGDQEPKLYAYYCHGRTEAPKNPTDYCSCGEKQITSKLNNADDSLLTEDLEDCKEKKGKLDVDIISRQAAINAIENTDVEITEEEWDELTNAIESLPSAAPKPVEDAISREYMLEVQKKLRGYMPNDKNHELWDKIKNAPPVEPQRPRGEWLGEGDGYADGGIVYDTWYCSECDHCEEGEEPALPNFCPNCGADMRGGAENE